VEKQIPFGDDRKKGKSKSKDKGEDKGEDKGKGNSNSKGLARLNAR
jgi:hypothetical protein